MFYKKKIMLGYNMIKGKYLKFKNILFIIFIFSTAVAICQEGKINNTLWTVAWSPDGNYLATGGGHGNLKIFDGNNFSLLKTFEVQDVLLSRLKWHPEKNQLAVITQSNTFKTQILDLNRDQWIPVQGIDDSFRGLDWNFDGTLLALSGREGEIYICNDGGEIITKFDADPKSATGVDWHPNKNILVAVGSQIGFFDIHGQQTKTILPREKEVFLLCVEWHKSGKFFAVGDYGDLELAENKMIQFWDSSGRKIREITGSKGEYRNIRWSPNGRRLASASDALRIWNKRGKLIAQSTSSEDYLWGVDWSPDGKMIVTSSSNGKLAVWNNKAELIKEVIY